jgi:hypothetical protein
VETCLAIVVQCCCAQQELAGLQVVLSIGEYWPPVSILYGYLNIAQQTVRFENSACGTQVPPLTCIHKPHHGA